MEIVPIIPVTKRGFPATVPVAEIVNAILYMLKTGVQWNQLPVRALFSEVVLSWQRSTTIIINGAWKDFSTKFLAGTAPNWIFPGWTSTAAIPGHQERPWCGRSGEEDTENNQRPMFDR